MPIRFDLTYESGDVTNTEVCRPVMIHRAIYGSMERFLAVLIEHLGGKWPFWLSPRQAIVIPIAKEYDDYAQIVRERLHNEMYYCDVDLSDKRLNKKMRDAEVAHYSYIIVVGKEEKEHATVNVRTRDSESHRVMSMEALLDEFAAKTKNYE